MADRDHAPLSAACVRALNDKTYEKRKVAALEIEKMVKEFSAANDTVHIRRLLKVLGQDFINSQNAHTRRGGLIGLAAISIGLGKDAANYISDLVNPILACMSDTDLRTRYFACESLYNVMKVSREAILVHFSDIFSALSKLVADPDQNVKNGTELLDRLMKDIVTESSSFDLVACIVLLRNKIYTRNTFTRQFIISWVSVLDAVPDINLIPFLPEILDGLFRILEDPTPEINKMCDTALGEFLCGIKQDPSKVDFSGMINILITHAQATDELLQFTALTWIKEFVQLSGRTMLPFASGILMATLPCLSYDCDSRRNIKETAKAVNYSLMKLISDSDASEEQGDGSPLLDLTSVVEVLSKQLLHSSVPTKVSVLGWIGYLHLKVPSKMDRHVDELFPILLKVMSDTSDEVVQQDLAVLAGIMSSPSGVSAGCSEAGDGDAATSQENSSTEDSVSTVNNPYFSKFLLSLLKLFSLDKHLLEDRGSFIIRQLCVLLNPEDIYRTLSVILGQEENVRFAATMVEHLNTILLTSSELFELRTKLRDVDSEESCHLFCSLYDCWCHDPVATVALCFLTQNYGHVCDLVHNFGNLEVTVEFLTEIDRLVQLIESPIFTYLRLELLEVPHNRYLVQALYGLLMLLPQTDAFHTLRRRLDCVPGLHLHSKVAPTSEGKAPNKHDKYVDFASLLKHFVAVQEKHRRTKQAARSSALLDRKLHNAVLDSA